MSHSTQFDALTMIPKIGTVFDIGGIVSHFQLIVDILHQTSQVLCFVKFSRERNSCLDLGHASSFELE